MFLGVIARDAGDREQAIAHLRKAHEMAPQEPNPALELGFTLEAQHPNEARIVYEQILARDPASRPAMLGLARVARSQNRLDEAAPLYERLLAVNSRGSRGAERDGLAGAGRAQPRSGARRVRARARNRAGQRGSEDRPVEVRRTSTAICSKPAARWFRPAQGTSLGSRCAGMAGVTAFDTLELGWQPFQRRIVRRCRRSASPRCRRDDITVGYHRLVPLSYAFSLVYDYRDYTRPAHRALDRWQRRHLSHRRAADGSAATASPSAPTGTTAA